MKGNRRNTPLSIVLDSIDDLSGLRVTVMGLGLNGGGLASARFLAQKGAVVTVTDMKDEASLAEPIAALSGLPIRYVLGRHEMPDFADADLVVKNPAVRPDSPYLAAARDVETDISLFLRFCESPVIAVTGSKGKSSVSSAIWHGLTHSGYEAFLGGNIAVSPLTFMGETTPTTPVVLELSSWQLADIRGKGILRPCVAVLTSIMPDHMNRYASMDEYVSDKRLIYADQDRSSFTVCNHDDPWGRSFASQTPGSVRWYSDSRVGLPGAWLEGGELPLGLYSPSGSLADAQEILPTRLLVPGPHQRKNLLASSLACRLYGAASSSVYTAMSTFPGVEHRLEFFAEKNGISWYNDSAATIPQAVAAALDSFSGRVVLITGGTDKNLDFAPVRRSYAKAAAMVLLSGTGTDKLKAFLDEDGIAYSGPYDDLASAVQRSLSIAKSGDTILLSPGCTSFGMFLHEFDRGRKFKETVKALLEIP
jgi:UDP-N-acetylmuramoylalanine--D-glutamate ligase